MRKFVDVISKFENWLNHIKYRTFKVSTHKNTDSVVNICAINYVSFIFDMFVFVLVDLHCLSKIRNQKKI